MMLLGVMGLLEGGGICPELDKSMGDGVEAAPSLGEASIGLEALPRMGVNV